MDRAFMMYWMDGHDEVIWGASIEDASQKAGIGSGAIRALDYWEEVKSLSPEKHLVHVDGKQIYNPSFISQMKESIANGLKVGETVFINFYKGFTFKYVGDTGLTFSFNQI